MKPIHVVIIVSAITTACHSAISRGVMTTSTTRAPILPTALIPRSPSAHQLDSVTFPPPPLVCPDATNMSSPLGRLRNAMKNVTYTQSHTFFDAFIVFHTDEHLTEEPAPEERRLEYISGWDGPGKAVVLAEGGAAIWVPSGEVNRAKLSLTCAWKVFDDDDINQPSIADWIAESAGLGRTGHVGGDARLVSMSEWQTLTKSLQQDGHQLVHMPTLLDQLWNDETDPMKRRPEFSRIVANLHSVDYIGQSWRDKVIAVRTELQSLGADAMVVTALDEVAWLLNVRGRDLPYAPLLKAFVVISSRDVKVYAPPGKLSMPVREALGAYTHCPNTHEICTKVLDYTIIYADLHRNSEWNRILIPTAETFHRGASAAIAQSVSIGKRVFLVSPIIALKAQKSVPEINGMHKGHLRDAVAMSTVLSYLEQRIKSTSFDEISIANKVDMTRATQAGYISPSMRTKVSCGPNSADPDYQAINATKLRLLSNHKSNSMLVIHSGGQYVEGTTIVTRTVYFGNPSQKARLAYTTTLRAVAALATLVIPSTLLSAYVDPVARAPLWKSKQDYMHPTGHGIGAGLNSKEGPIVIDYRQDANVHMFMDRYFITSEPAWYEPGQFGVRLGNVFEVIGNTSYLHFRECTLLPYEPKLIDTNMLTDYEVIWLNGYNQRIRETVGPELKSQGLMDVYYWMMNKTQPINKRRKLTVSSGHSRKFDLIYLVLGAVVNYILSSVDV